MRSITLMAAALLAAGCGAGSAPGPEKVTERRELMGTEVTVICWEGSLPAGEVRGAVERAFARMGELEGILSNHRPESEISRLNAGAGGGAAKVGPELGAVLGLARDAWSASGGAFDPTVGPLIGLWIRAAKADRIPAESEVEAALSRVGLSRVAMRPGSGPVTEIELPQGFSIDLGGIAKGYIVDEAAGVLLEAGISNAMVEAGGDIFCCGSRIEGGPWLIGVQDPAAQSDPAVVRTLAVTGRGVTTSGHYRRYSTIAGKRYSHILDPRTGRPVEQTVLSVTVIARDAALADGLSTAVAVLGAERGLALVDSIDGVEGLIIAAGEGGAPRFVESSGLGGFLAE